MTTEDLQKQFNKEFTEQAIVLDRYMSKCHELEQKLSACEIVLEDTQEEIRVWKSVDFERPEIAVIVCIMLKGSDRCHVGFRANGGWYIFNLESKTWIPNDEKSGAKITHWQELPKILGTDRQT